MIIEYSNVDRKLNLSLYSLTNILQNKMTTFLETLNLDTNTLKKDYGAFWAISKLKICINNYPMLNDIISYSTNISTTSKIRLNLDYIFSDKNQKTLIVAKHEICPVDFSSRKIKKIDHINNLPKKSSNLSFSKWQNNIDEFEKCFDYTILYCDTDSNCHVNNASYVRFILNTFDSDFLCNNTITNLEIHYLNECLEKQLISVYRKIVNNEIFFLILRDSTKIIEAKLTFN